MADAYINLEFYHSAPPDRTRAYAVRVTAAPNVMRLTAAIMVCIYFVQCIQRQVKCLGR